MPGRFDFFTERARVVLTYADEEATRFDHNYIGTEHLLLGLVREEEGIAAKVLSNLGVDLTKVRSAVEFIIGRGERKVTGEKGLTPRCKRVIDLAVDEARRLGHHYIGTEHLLLGLIREGEGIAAGVLESLGVNLEKVRSETLMVLDEDISPEAKERDEPSRADVKRRQHAWEYLVLHTMHEGGVVRVQSADVPQDLPFSLDQKPIHEALHIVGNDGWELVGIDSSPQRAGTLYILKRPGNSGDVWYRNY